MRKPVRYSITGGMGVRTEPPLPWLDAQGNPPDALLAWRIGYAAGYWKALYHLTVGRRMKRSWSKVMNRLLTYHQQVLVTRRGPPREPPETTPSPELESLAFAHNKHRLRLPWEGPRGREVVHHMNDAEAEAWMIAEGLAHVPTEESGEETADDDEAGA